MSATRFLFIVATVAGVGLGGGPRAAEPTHGTPKAQRQSIGLCHHWMANVSPCRFPKAAVKTARFISTRLQQAKRCRTQSRMSSIPRREVARLGTPTAAEFITRAFHAKASG